MNLATILLFHAFVILAWAQDKTVMHEVWRLSPTLSNHEETIKEMPSNSSSSVPGQEALFTTDTVRNCGEDGKEISSPRSSSFFMFNTGTGINMVEYLREKLDEEEAETFKHDKPLIDLVIVEYHKFLELTKHGLESGHDKFAYIPSKIMDLVWHWHILHTYEYHLMCNKQFNGKFLHHRPFFGKEKIEMKKARAFTARVNKYKRTLRDYHDYFGEYPPNTIWATHKFSNFHSIADCDEMTACDTTMASCDCDEMTACDTTMASCDEMHACDTTMAPADCDEMHACDTTMASCDEMHACDTTMAPADCDEMTACDTIMPLADCQMHACDSD